MKSRTAFWLAWSTCALTLAMVIAIVVLSAFNQRGFDAASFSIVGLASAVVGGVVASKRPDNPVGWLFLGGAFLGGLRGLTGAYAVYGILVEPGSLPLPYAAAWFSNAIEFLGPVLTFILIPLYFPTGRPVSWRWGLVAWLALGMLPLATVMSAFSPGRAVTGTGIQNPLGIEALRPVEGVLGPVLFVWFIGLIFASAASLVLRFWRSQGVERQQIKWFTFAAAFVPVWFMTNRPVEEAAPILFGIMDAFFLAAVPVAAGVAIMRYRLYDIDIIINRTLVYLSLTVSLVLLYFGGVVLLQQALNVLTGGGSQLAVVASTLFIAALFNPLRRVIQAFIDRRFYRRKYNAAKTMEDFSRKLRNETDLEQLNAEIVSAIRVTMQPEHVSLWLRRHDGGIHS